MRHPTLEHDGFTRTPTGALEYSHASIRAALGVTDLTGTPSHYAMRAQAAEAGGDRRMAATLYLAAGLVSAGLGRTLQYEEQARRLSRQAAHA